MVQPSIGVVVVTHRARRLLDGCLAPLLASPLRPQILVVNSSSHDGTVERAWELGAETWTIPRESFDHGRTRELARQRLGTAITVMLTPDAHATGSDFLELLTAPLRDGRAAVAYGRQLPRPGADRIEAETGLAVLRFPKEVEFFIGFRVAASRPHRIATSG